MDNSSIVRRQAWTSYWKSGVLHSCPTSFSANYEGAIAEFWIEACTEMPRNARVLDLATGNGSIPKLLVAKGRCDIEIDAVDAAQVTPGWYSSSITPQIRFHAGVWIERLPFPDVTFDCACSQFGVEYAKRPEAWDEVLRVLKPNSQIHWVMHHSDSVFARVAAHESNHLEWLLGSDGLLEVAIELAPWLARLRKGEPVANSASANAIRGKFNLVQDALEHRIRTSEHVDVLLQTRAELQTILSRAADPLSALVQYRSGLEGAHLRCTELITCALDGGQIEELCEWLRKRQPMAIVQTMELCQKEGVLAWGLRSMSA